MLLRWWCRRRGEDVRLVAWVQLTLPCSVGGMRLILVRIARGGLVPASRVSGLVVSVAVRSTRHGCVKGWLRCRPTWL